MNLIGQNEEQTSKKGKKIVLSILIICVVLLVIVIALIVFFSYENSKELKFYVDGQRKEIPSGLFIFDETNGKIYMPIEEVAKLNGYEFFKGEYKMFTEDQTNCYIDNKNEIASFSSGSDKLYKYDATNDNSYAEEFSISEPVKIINNKLYCSSDGLEIGCNMQFKYDSEKNSISIYTLPYLVTYYQEKAVSYGYVGIADTYSSKKVILYDMLVIYVQDGKDQLRYGVISTDNQTIIGTKYDAIDFIEVSKEFKVTASGNIGVLSSTGEKKIEPAYDQVELLDNNLRLYYVENDSLKGVLDKNGKRVVYIEYEKIGIDTTLFPSNKIQNGRLLFDNCIPVMKNAKWGLFDKNGNVLTNTIFESLGCISSTTKDKSQNNLLIIPSIEGIVVCRDKKYGIINSVGKMVAPCVFEKIYSVTDLGEDTYYMVYNGQTINLKDYIAANNINTNVDDNSNQNQNIENSGQTVNQEQSNNQNSQQQQLPDGLDLSPQNGEIVVQNSGNLFP